MKSIPILLLTMMLAPMAGAVEPKIKQERGGSEVKAVQYKNGDWQLLVDGKPWFIKGVVYGPVRIGEDPGAGTMSDWMTYDIDGNGKNDLMYDVWAHPNPQKNKKSP